jgi:hypothetical protein
LLIMRGDSVDDGDPDTALHGTGQFVR